MYIERLERNGPGATMFMQDCIPLERPNDWREALVGIGHAFAHTWENCYAMYLTTGLKTYLYRYESQGIRIVCPFAERAYGSHVDIVTPYGFSGFAGNGDSAEFAGCWRRFAQDQGYVCGYVGLNPLIEHPTSQAADYAGDEVYEYNSVYVLDLTLDYSELFANLSSNRRRQLKDWQQQFSLFTLEKRLLADFFHTNYAGFMAKKNASSTYMFTQETLAFLMEQENVLVVGVRDLKKVLAVSLFTYTSYMGDFLLNISLPEGQHYSAGLIWYGVNYLKSCNIPLLNLGGGVKANDGVAEFKQRFGANKLALKCLKQVYQPAIYEALCREAGVDSHDRSGYFPPYRRS